MLNSICFDVGVGAGLALSVTVIFPFAATTVSPCAIVPSVTVPSAFTVNVKSVTARNPAGAASSWNLY